MIKKSLKFGLNLIFFLVFIINSPTPSFASRPPKKVLVIVFNPVIESQGNRKLIELLGWNNPDYLNQIYISALKEVSNGFANYEIGEKLEVDDFPEKQDGFDYSDETYLQCWYNHNTCHSPDTVNYEKIFRDFNICDKVRNNNIAEVWLWGGPWFGFWESALTGKDAFWFSSSPYKNIDCGKLVPVMGFSYERGGPMLENFSHRVEATMTYVFGSWGWFGYWPSPPYVTNLNHDWDKFTLVKALSSYDFSGCGNVHYPPNGTRDYDWYNRDYVLSDCDDWYHYPHLTGEKRLINCNEWGCSNCEQPYPNCPEGAKYHKWWLRHLPKAEGKTNGKWNNWWKYIIDLENTIGTCNYARSGDINCDYLISGIDFGLLLASWGPLGNPPPNPSPDLNGNGLVDVADLRQLILNYGKTH